MEPEHIFTPENQSSTQNPEVSKNHFLKFKSKLSFIFLKIKNKWILMPSKFRIAFSVFSLLLLILGVYTIFSGKINILNKVRQVSQKNLFEQLSEGWTKLQIPERELAFFTLRPQTQGKYGILPNETFILKTQKPVSDSFIKEKLKSSTPVKVISVSESEFRISTSQTLKNDEVVTLSLPVKDEVIDGHTFDRNYGWSFQTQGKFRVTTSIPGDKKTNVPLNSGIEITFSQDDYKDPKNLISISPSIEWRGERHAETYAIVPLKPLNPKTVYTLTLKKGLSPESRNDPIQDDFTFSFQTQELAEGQNLYNLPRISLRNNFLEVSPNETPAVGAYSSNWGGNTNIKTIIYKFADSTQFIQSRKGVDEAASAWWSYFAEDEKVDTTNLAKVSEIDLKLQTKENLDYLQLPESLPQGFYLIQFWYENGKKLEQLWLQSTNISAYTSLGRKQTLVWVNNIESGKPIEGAQITLVGLGSNYATSENGIAVFSTPQTFFERLIHYIKVSAQEGELILPVSSLNLNYQSQQKNPKDYWSYLYHERLLYKPGDTVFFWGVIKDRDTGSIPLNVEVNLTTSYYYSDYDKNSPLKSVKITPDTNGTFIGNLTLDRIPEGYYSLNLVVGDVNVASSGFQIKNYEKPEMKIEVTSNKKAIFSTEKADFTAKVSFFDDTPAKKVPLNIYKSQYASGEKTEMQTDANGEIKYTYEPKYEEGDTNYSRYPRYESITINPALTISANIEGFGSVYVYGSKLMLSSTSRQEGKKAYLNATLNRVNLDNINEGKSSDVKGNPVSGKDVNVVITKTWWKKIETGTYYDFIEKITRPSYRYERHDEKILDKKLTSNSNGEISYEFDIEKDKSYQLTLSVEDEDRHKTFANEYFYYYEGYQDYSSFSGSSQPELTIDKEENEFSVGEIVNLTIKSKGEIFPDDDKNQFLFILAQRGIQDFFVKEKPEFNFNFEIKHIPNTFASVVIFNGKYYQIANPNCLWDWGCSYSYYDSNYFNSLIIRYKKEDSDLDLEIRPNQNKYNPGDTAKISVLVKKDGRPVSNAQVNLVLVDLALEAIGGVRKPSILESLYSAVPNEIYYNYYSHKPLTPPPSQAEMGGGGGEERELFKDTPFFGQSKTNESGIVEFEFTLSDNITTWLTYAQGLSENFDAGQAENKIITSKDFFITSNFPREYLQRDLSFITGNGFGNAIGQNQTISYELTILKENNQVSKKTFQGNTLKDASIQFPDLQTGDYRVWFKGTTGNLSDGIIYPLKVVESRLDLQMDKKYQLEKGQSLEKIKPTGLNNQKPLNIIISDIGRGQYYYQLFGFCNIFSNRVEKVLAKQKANSVISEIFQEEVCKVKNEELSVYQNFDGGLSQVPWGGSSLETTVWAIYINPFAFDKEKIINFLERKLNDTNGGNIQKIYSFWGLTLLGKPHINELIYATQNAINFDEKVTSALALATIGETEIPREIYLDILSDYAYTNKPYIRIQSDTGNNEKTIDKYVSDTGKVLLLGSIVEKKYNEGMYLYLRDYKNQVEDIVIDLGKIAFINEELRNLPLEDTQITFKSNSREEIINLSKGGGKSISLLEGEIDSARLDVLKGKADLSVNYFVTPEIFSSIQKDSRLKIEREYKKVKGEGNTIKPGDIIQITINFDLDKENAPLGSYTITDHLPSGLTYIENSQMYGLEKKGWAYQEENNIIKYYFYNSPWWQKYGVRSFTYYARASAVGTYLAEPSILQSQLDLSVIQSTPEDVVKIENQN